MEQLILRQAAIDALRTCYDTETITMDNGDEYIHYGDAVGEIEQLQPIQPEITHEQAVAYLQSTGWMQEHDRQMMLDGVHRLTAQPEIVRCKDCKHHWTHRCMDSMPIERCDLGQTFYDAEVDFCSLAEKREVTT